MSTLITVGLRSFQRSLPCGGSRGIRGRGFAIFVSKKLKLLTFHKEIIIMPAINNQFNGTNFDYSNNNMFIQYYHFGHTWCYR